MLATCVLLLAVASDLLSSADALKLGMGKDWEKTMWDECKMEGRSAAPQGLHKNIAFAPQPLPLEADTPRDPLEAYTPRDQ